MFKPAFLYFALTFAVGFILGAFRMMVVVPRVGEVVAVLIECPLILLASFFIARWVVARYAANAGAGRRLSIGLIAFALLMCAEFLMSVARGISPREYADSLFRTAGAIGLAGQIGFALIPLIVEPKVPGARGQAE
jgi:hypothetical protein